MCHPGGIEEMLGVCRKAQNKFKDLLGLALERAYKVQSDKHFCFKPATEGLWAALEIWIVLREK